MKSFLVIFLICAMSTSIAKAEKSRFCADLGKNITYAKKKAYKKIIEGQDGWVFRTKIDFNDAFKMNGSLLENFTRMDAAFKAHDIQLVISLLPTRGLMHHELIDYPYYNFQKSVLSYTALAKNLKDIGIPVASVEDFSPGQNYFYKKDHHWNTQGAMAMAKTTATIIKKLPVYASLTKKKFKTEIIEKAPHEETFTMFINKVCGRDDQFEKHDLYKTYAETSLEDDLFESEVHPDVVLIGTSNSFNYASDANFDGFLREFIGADVENFSVSGGGVDTAMLEWFNSENYQNHKPKIVIWEIPVHQNFKGSSFYRQAIPAIYGDCGDRAVLSGHSDISEGKFKVSFEGKGHKISTKEHYLYLKFSEFKGRRFRSTTHYGDYKKESFDFKRSKFFQSAGTFFLDFDKLSNDTITSINGLTPKDTTGDITVKVCRYKS